METEPTTINLAAWLAIPCLLGFAALIAHFVKLIVAGARESDAQDQRIREIMARNKQARITIGRDADTPTPPQEEPQRRVGGHIACIPEADHESALRALANGPPQLNGVPTEPGWYEYRAPDGRAYIGEIREEGGGDTLVASFPCAFGHCVASPRGTKGTWHGPIPEPEEGP